MGHSDQLNFPYTALLIFYFFVLFREYRALSSLDYKETKVTEALKEKRASRIQSKISIKILLS